MLLAQNYITEGGIDYAKEVLEKALVLRKQSKSSIDLHHPCRLGPLIL